jgi:3-oxoacyl-ACP reductase-like protein
MPKSRRSKQRGKRKGRKTFSAPASQTPVAAEAVQPAPVAGTPAPTVPKPKAPVVATQATNVAAELRRIGIVAGSILVILVILALILT